MSTDSEGSATILRFERPPVRQSTLVHVGREVAFRGFVRHLGGWWPVNPFSAGKDRVCAVTVEERVGGRVVESWPDGTEVSWGELLVWQPPERFVLSWAMTPVTTEVELTFAELGPALTRVSVEHRGWEALDDEQAARDCALPGGYTGGAYATGWQRILGAYAASLAAGAAADGPEDGKAEDGKAEDR